MEPSHFTAPLRDINLLFPPGNARTGRIDVRNTEASAIPSPHRPAESGEAASTLIRVQRVHHFSILPVPCERETAANAGMDPTPKKRRPFQEQNIV